MKLNLRSRFLRLRLCGFAMLVLLIGLLAFWPSRKPELSWRLLSVTESNGAWIAEIELTNSGKIGAYVVERCITQYAEGWEGFRTPKGFLDAITVTEQRRTVAAGEHFRMRAIIPGSTTNWWIHARTVPLTAEAKLAQWMEQRGWFERLPDSVKGWWRSRFERQRIGVSAGPFTNAVNVSQ